MTDAEAHEYVVRTDAFIDDIFELLTNTQPVNPNAGRQLVAIAKTIDAVDYIDLCNLATLNEVMHGALLDAIEVKLACIGAGSTLDYADAPAFFAELQSVIETGLKRDAAELCATPSAEDGNGQRGGNGPDSGQMRHDWVVP